MSSELMEYLAQNSKGSPVGKAEVKCQKLDVDRKPKCKLATTNGLVCYVLGEIGI